MADTKRQSIGGKVPVATPNIGPPSTISLEAALMAAAGSKMRLTLNPPFEPRTLEGTLHSVSSTQNLITLTQPGAGNTTTYHIINLSWVQSYQLLALEPNFANFTSLVPLDHAAMQARLEATIAAIKTEDAKVGKGVSKEAQEIFDAIGRTLPTRWDGANIIVSDAVMIVPPYRSEDCKAGTGAATQSLGRVKMVLEKERKKLAEKSGNNKPAVPAAAQPTGGQRKGG